MNKTILVIMGLLATGLVTAGVVFASGAEKTNNDHHEQMEKIIEEGTYQDLVDYRDDTDYRMAPWVDSKEDFETLNERHEQMEDTSDFQRGRQNAKRRAGHEEMESIVENGDYEELVNYREETGQRMAPWVDSEGDFQRLQERHEEMNHEGKQGPNFDERGASNCPMRQ